MTTDLVMDENAPTRDHGVVNLSLIDGFGLWGSGKANIDGAAKDFFVKCDLN